jgi:hypothetical protein
LHTEALFRWYIPCITVRQTYRNAEHVNAEHAADFQKQRFIKRFLYILYIMLTGGEHENSWWRP